MKILALDCSAGPASVAVIENGKIIASSFSNVKLTHSQTLLPMVEGALGSARLSVSDIDILAIEKENGGKWEAVQVDLPHLSVPHPQLESRDFARKLYDELKGAGKAAEKSVGKKKVKK